LELDQPVTEFRVKQKLQSFDIYPNEYFGYAVSISPNAAKIAVGARNTRTPFPINFDILEGTTFDNTSTRFFVDQGFTGGVYVFDKKDQVFLVRQTTVSDFVFSYCLHPGLSLTRWPLACCFSHSKDFTHDSSPS
jgi:hypothetical protein